jgi:catechol 2,3-dioxygenase-like lactoylglutathione lyase family enzyme
MVLAADVEASSRWYQEVLGLRSGHGGAEYEMLFDGDDFVLQLHRLDTDEHPAIRRGDGDGVLLWFATDQLDAASERAAARGALVAEALHENPLSRQRELWLRDLDGHLVVLSGP